ncbi:sensor histidine kinase [Nocardia alni]|uniref:sensor histidine kinase n=1 Tax=Nocardia alni TaxID=2815723 RepID=UPI0027DF7FD7|nr:nitrate- and nitrite sensing domain-containing protein [Nocardia alni]
MTQGMHARNWSKALAAATPQSRELVTAVQLERQYSIARLADGGGDPGPLMQARVRFDAISAALDQTTPEFDKIGHSEVTGDIGGIQTAKARLASIRAQVDARTLPIADVYNYYSHFLDAISVGSEIVETDAPTPRVASEVAAALSIVSASEMLSRSAALGSVLAHGETLPPQLAIEYSRLVGGYRTSIEAQAGRSPEVKTVTTSPAWLQLIMMENTLLARALDPITAAPSEYDDTPTPAPMSFTPDDWSATTGQVDNALLTLWDGQMVRAHNLAAQAADRNAHNALVIGGVLLAAAVAAFGVSLLLANRVIGRLHRLRNETLALASEQLPRIMQRLRAGEKVDVSAESTPLAFGTDEIGQVADAFNRAQIVAVTAAVTEADTREGVRTVFLNIAHRSQIVVHRQLEILDEAESSQEDPALLDIFFDLDHLATRERRNAENLIILAGGEPGRGWRNPVQLLEIIRSSVSETVDFRRVKIVRAPDLMIAGSAVADLVHLLAELIDNAAYFSPSQSQVEVRANVVGKGVAVEIADQGMGMAGEQYARLNAVLADPPDFGVGTLSEDSRLGMFVVAQLARRNDVAVRLTESDFGGVRAIVVVPSKFIVAEASTSTGTWRAVSDPSGELPGRVAQQVSAGSWSPDSGDGFAAPAPVPPHPGFAGNGHAEPGVRPRPALPRRRRQASLAPELTNEARRAPDLPGASDRTPEQARDIFSAIETGTMQGRQADPGAPRP